MSGKNFQSPEIKNITLSHKEGLIGLVRLFLGDVKHEFEFKIILLAQSHYKAPQVSTDNLEQV